ncbi:MAG: SDR family oxidoreductase [Pseudomonadota bacterium]
MIDLQGKVVIVTGASSGVGRAAAKKLVEQGANVVASARRTQELETLCDECSAASGTMMSVAGDVRDETLQQTLVNTAVEHFGRLDGAFNNAGVLGPSTQTELTTLAEWTNTIHINLTAAFTAAQAQIPQMRINGGGSIVYTGSFVGCTAGLPGMSAYAASKAGLDGLVKVLAVEGATAGIRVNAITAGGVNTPMAHQSAPTPEAKDAVVHLHALQRIADPDEIAEPALFLLSDSASFMTGTSMLVDGGVSIKKG